MGCKPRMTWGRAMRIVRMEYPSISLESRRKIAAKIMRR